VELCRRGGWDDGPAGVVLVIIGLGS